MSEHGKYHINDMLVEDGGPLTRSLIALWLIIECTFKRDLYARGKIFAEGQGSSLHVGGANMSGITDP